MAQLEGDLHMQLAPGSNLQKMVAPVDLFQDGAHILRLLEMLNGHSMYQRNVKHLQKLFLWGPEAYIKDSFNQES